MKMEPIESHQTVIFCDTDSGGVGSNMADLRFGEKARGELFASLGMDLPSMNQTRRFPSPLRRDLDFHVDDSKTDFGRAG